MLENFKIALTNTGLATSPIFLEMKKHTDLADYAATRKLYAWVADGFAAFAKFTPNKADDQLAAVLLFGINSDLVWMGFCKLMQDYPNIPLDQITLDMCDEYCNIANAAAINTNTVIGAGFFNRVTFRQFVQLAATIRLFIEE